MLMTLSGGEAGNRNARLIAQLWLWNEPNQRGKVFDSSTCFKLPNGMNRSPDAAWVKQERWLALTAEEKEKFPPLCPDFVVELVSSTDQLKDVQEKMQEYVKNGAGVAWLINRTNRQVEIYRPDRKPQILNNPITLSGGNVLPGFLFSLERIW